MEEKKFLLFVIFELAPDSNYEFPLAKELLSYPLFILLF